MAEQNLRAIFFDIDDTLFSTTEFADKARRNSIREMIRHGLKMDAEEAHKELKEVITEFSSNYPHHFDKLLKRIPTTLYAGLNPAVLIAAAVVGYHNTKKELTAYPDVIEALELLSRTKLILGVITAGLEIKQAEKLVRMGLVKYLTPTAIFISDQIGISKPNVKLYKVACSSLGLDPRTAMYIGDNPTNDIDPPNRLGMITVRDLRSTRRRDEKGETEPRYEINNFHELLDIVERDFGIPLPGRRNKMKRATRETSINEQQARKTRAQGHD
ncbi:MAG: TIGR02253 family HAD-type hydrolase [Planctomycetota bacterium]